MNGPLTGNERGENKQFTCEIQTSDGRENKESFHIYKERKTIATFKWGENGYVGR